VISIDDGPGIADIDRCLGDGYSTGGTPGTGLGAVRRLAQRLRHPFLVPQGTVVVARVRGRRAADSGKADRICVGAVSLAAPAKRSAATAGLRARGRAPPCWWPTAWATAPTRPRPRQAAGRCSAGPLAAPRQQVERVHRALRPRAAPP
jgi:hypothetical protein